MLRIYMKPVKPKKTIEVPGGKTFYFDFTSNKISLDYFLGQIKERAPKNAKNFMISIQEDMDDTDGSIISCSIFVEWKYKVKNTRYNSEMKRYEKQLAKWKKTNGKR